ncbi:MAG: hypothetical protein CBD77_03030 [bacterium TMED217]|nr:MAG: hypothetical protein CBD77_03030 [bacterium TMED217]
MGFFISAQIIIELGFVYLYMTVMRKWFKKNENALTKIGTTLFVLSFIDFFTLTMEGNILSIIIVVWLFYSIYKQGGLFKENH